MEQLIEEARASGIVDRVIFGGSFIRATNPFHL
jgi:hypothetical protein